MRKYACLLLLCATPLHAAETEEMSINVESTRLSDVSGEELKSADLADALTKKVPSVSLVRRSGIANDIILRGQKKDNINILVDGTKTYGACPNRMDPPTSHILTNNIDGVDIVEGPYDVENFGTLSGAVKITTKKPSKEMQGEIGVNFGSWNYRKQYTTISGGSDSVRFLLSASKESSDQYKDGDGNDFYDQIQNLNLSLPAGKDPQYQDKYKDLAAYEKRTVMGKIYADITDNQELRLSYTANRSDDVLYPSSGMDALYDNSDIFNAGYTLRNLGRYSSALDLQYFDSKVKHPMSTRYRVKSGTDSINEMVSVLTTEVKGFKVKNRMDIDANTGLTLGVDSSVRNWDGHYEKDGMMASTVDGRISIDDVDTTNRAVFAELKKRFSATSVKAGLRYDNTHIATAGTLNQQSNDYSSVSANIFANYHLNNSTRLFAGVGRSHRVPDARELYFMAAMNSAMPMGPQPEVGTPDLKQTTNTEVDLGAEKHFQNASVKVKVFHSRLTDYIYFNADKSTNAFENIDATIYGGSISGSWYATDTVYFDFGMAYQRGQKDDALDGQTDKDLAEITPLKANLALNYDYAAGSTARIEWIGADKWSNYDADNGEQEIAGYQVVNLKLQHAVTSHFEVTAGVDNLFDKTYAVTNTYKDLSLLVDSNNDVMLMNEPGRYYYVNAAYKF